MTYHNKLLLKKAAKLLAFIVLIIIIILLIGFFYLSRYLVYDEEGAHFSFHTASAAATDETIQTTSAPESVVLVTGDPAAREISDEDTASELAANEVNGLFVDYATLSDSAALNAVEISGYNTLVLEMRKNGSEILNSSAVLSFIERAQSENIHLKAMMSCLDDGDFALENSDAALHIEGGALWVYNHTYYLNPGSEITQKYLEEMINSLCEMGFEEVILDNFQYPTYESIVDDTGNQTRSEVLFSAFNSIKNSVSCTLGLLVTEISYGHDAYDAADHLYVYASTGSSLKTYMEYRTDYYIVFITDSHDTRFDDYGKIESESSIADIELISQQDEADAEESEDDTAESEEPADEEAGTETDDTLE